jgi:hypothetical protein
VAILGVDFYEQSKPSSTWSSFQLNISVFWTFPINCSWNEPNAKYTLLFKDIISWRWKNHR